MEKDKEYERLKELVKIEADNLRRFATEKELDSLDFNTLDATNIHYCIYGQMTDSCTNDRALDLIEKCCDRVYQKSNTGLGLYKTYDNESAITKYIHSDERLAYYMSPIEKFILLPLNGENAKALIDYLKGENSELIFS